MKGIWLATWPEGMGFCIDNRDTLFYTFELDCSACIASSRSGETGRRRGLKILRPLRSCRFDSDLRHQSLEGRHVHDGPSYVWGRICLQKATVTGS